MIRRRRDRDASWEFAERYMNDMARMVIAAEIAKIRAQRPNLKALLVTNFRVEMNIEGIE